MKIFDLITQGGGGAFKIIPSPDALYADDVLIDATILDLLHYTLFSTTAILLDLRTSIYLNQGNTAVIICREVNEIALKDNVQRSWQLPHVWMIGDSKITETENGLHLLLPLVDSSIQILANKIEFYIGTVNNIGEVAVSLDEGMNNYVKTTPHWESDFEINTSSFRV